MYLPRWRAQRCAGCGAALPRPDPDDATLTCAFCGLTTERAPSLPQVLVKWDLEASIRQLGRKAKLALILGLGVAATIVAVTILRAVKPITEALDSVREQSEQMQEALRKIAPSELSTMEPGRWRAVAVTPPPGGYAGFDPVGRLDWVLNIARRWAPDATLERIEGGPIAPDGTVNLAAGAEASLAYRFLSAQRMADWDRNADLRKDLEADYRLELAILAGHVTAAVTRGRPPSTTVPPSEPMLTVGDVLTRARRNGFPERPFYVGSLIHLGSAGWVWQLQTPSGREALPRVRAGDGHVAQ